MVEKLEVIDRAGSWGTANMKKKALEETYGKGNVKIFKDLTDSPFTAFRTDQYVIALSKSNLIIKG